VQQLEAPRQSTAVSAVKYLALIAPERPPTHLLAWLPLVWTRILFPGRSSDPRVWRPQAFVLLFVLSGLLLYPCMSFHLFEPDEGRYAQIPREMLMRGDWIVPTLQGEAYLDKPPLFYWLVMVSYSIFGCHDAAARLIPALAMHGAVLLTYVLGLRIVGERSAFWGAVLLTVSPLFLGVGRLLVLDGLLTLWVTLALLAAYVAQAEPSFRRRWWLVAALACGLGVLTKGPVAVLLILPPLIAHRFLVRGAAPIGWRSWACLAAVVLAINLPWYLAVCVQRPEFTYYFLWQHNIQRFVEPFDHVRPVWFYGPILLFGLLPALLLAWPLSRYLLSTRPHEAQRRCVGLGYLLLAGLWCVFFYSLAGCKLPTYILPAFPILSLASGCFVARTDWHRSRRLIGLVAAGWLLLACSHYIVIPYFARQRSPMNHPDTVHAWCDDPHVPVLCFPRNVDSVAFYLGRDDFRTYRSKEMEEMLQAMATQPRTVILFAHRNSPQTLARHLPPHLRVVDRKTLGLCEMAVVEKMGGQRK